MAREALEGECSSEEPCTDCRGVGYAMFATDSKHGPYGLQLQRCDTCQAFADDDGAIDALWQVLENVLAPAVGEDVDGALWLIVEALRALAKGQRRPNERADVNVLADCFATITHERNAQARRYEED
jgi:hypothetical protein